MQDKQMRKISKNVSANLEVQLYKSDINTHSWLLWTYGDLNLWMVAGCGRRQHAPIRFLQERTRCSFAKAMTSGYPPAYISLGFPLRIIPKVLL